MKKTSFKYHIHNNHQLILSETTIAQNIEFCMEKMIKNLMNIKDDINNTETYQ